MTPIDLRSDTVTQPTPAMRRAMSEAIVGDDVLGDDPTVIRLQERVAEILGKPAACFVPSGTMANQTAIRAHTQPGDEVIAHKDSHIIHYETGAPAALSGVMVRPLEGDRGLFNDDAVEQAVRPISSHFPRSRLLIVENTHNRGGGSIWPLALIQDVTARAHAHHLACHLDGARLWNASIASGVAPSTYASHFDSVSCCFSKGLGSPAGSAVAGSVEWVARVHRFRKMFGGAMRQAGVLAAAALYALDHHLERLAEDHARARVLADGVGNTRGLSIGLQVETNMVFIDVDPQLGSASNFAAKLEAAGVRMLATSPQRVRAVCHLDVSREQIERAIMIISRIAGDIRSRPANVA
jgi:threonine aldolase